MNLKWFCSRGASGRRRAMAIRLILAAFAVYRLAGLIALDSGPFGVFERLRARAGRRAAGAPRYGLAWSLSEALNCPYCLGVWLAAPVWLLARSKNKWSCLTLGVLGVSGMQAFLEESSHGKEIV